MGLLSNKNCFRHGCGNAHMPTRSAFSIMTTNRLKFLFSVAAIGSVALTFTGCSDKKSSSASDSAAVAAAPSTSVPPIAAPAIAATATPSGVTPVGWADIKDDTYDQRVHFTAGLKGLESGVDDQIAALNAKRATLPAATDTKDWDFSMKEMGDARSALKSMGEELEKANADTWAEAKERVSQAWVRSQAAYDKVKGSTTA